MKPKIFKPVLLVLVAFLSFSNALFAQDAPAPNADSKSLSVSMKQLELTMNDLKTNLKVDFKDFGKNFSGSFSGMVPVAEIKDINLSTRVAYKPDNEKQKTYSKSYPVDGNDKLQINNKYGKVTINTWNKNEIKVDVLIKASASKDNDAQKYLDNISVSDSKDGDVVSFTTRFGNYNGSSGWSFWSGGGSHKIEVDYVVYMPAKNALDIDNKYGSTTLPDFDGKITIHAAYGSFTAQTLTHPDNSIKVRYGGANIQSFASGEIDVAYGGLDLDAADKLSADVSYGSVKIGKVKTSANISAHYAGTVKISELDKDFSTLSFDGSYSGIKVGMNNNIAADFDITVHYGSFSFGNTQVNVTDKTPPDSHKGFSSTQNYKGHVGKGSNDKKIDIRSSFGSVQFE